jgi:hypothetical protein
MARAGGMRESGTMCTGVVIEVGVRVLPAPASTSTAPGKAAAST